MAIIPYEVDVPMGRKPVANLVVVWGTVSIAVAAWIGHFAGGAAEAMAVDREKLSGLLDSTLVRAGPLHLFGSMIFLRVFGNAVCAKMGNVAYLAVYTLFALLAVGVHQLFGGAATTGVAVAINGVVGMFLVWYPLNSVSCYWMIIFPFGTAFETDSRWLIALWLIFDVFVGVALGFSGLAYWAHLGGFAVGFGLATLLLHLRWVRMDETERSLYDVLNIRIG